MSMWHFEQHIRNLQLDQPILDEGYTSNFDFFYLSRHLKIAGLCSGEKGCILVQISSFISIWRSSPDSKGWEAGKIAASCVHKQFEANTSFLSHQAQVCLDLCFRLCFLRKNNRLRDGPSGMSWKSLSLRALLWKVLDATRHLNSSWRLVSNTSTLVRNFGMLWYCIRLCRAWMAQPEMDWQCHPG